jgi:protein involved in polysaccharide export with SLBB domain
MTAPAAFNLGYLLEYVRLMAQFRKDRIGRGTLLIRQPAIIPILIVGALLPACTHRGLPENFRVAVPTAFPPTAAADIPLGIGDVVEVSYFKSLTHEGSYRLGTGDALEIVLRQGTASGPYKLAIGDQIDVVVKGTTDGGDYRLQVGDEISVIVPNRVDLSRQAVILRDGTVVLPTVGRVLIRGMTIREAVATLERRYRAYLEAPRIDLLMIKSVAPELRENVTVLPDGTGTVPLLGPVPLRGRTVDEIVTDLTNRYLAFYDKPKIDVLVTRSNPTGVTHKVKLLPDGRVTLPLVGAVRLGGMTVEEAAEALTSRYSAVLENTVADVLVVEPGGRIDDFFEILAQNPQGAAREATISDDGFLRLPLIPPIAAADRLFADVSAQIHVAYAQVLPELEVNTVFALRKSQRKITVLGEVVQGGMFDVVQPISVLEALALGGGFSDRAWRSQVLLLHPDYKERTLTVRILDMRAGLRMTDPSLLTTMVRAQDILYVPRTRIGDVNVAIQQFVTSLIPFNLRIEIVTNK